MSNCSRILSLLTISAALAAAGCECHQDNDGANPVNGTHDWWGPWNSVGHHVDKHESSVGVGGATAAPGHEGGMMHHEMMWNGVTEAVAVIVPTKGNSVSGTIHFTTEGDSVHVRGNIAGLDPNSVHAIHIHMYGDESSDDGMAAGGHYNPEGHQHGAPGSGEHHAGDLGNLNADASGNATLDLVLPGISIAGMHDPILGRGVVIHAKADDFGQPVGNAGGRIGVGVIGVAKPPQ